MIGSRFKSSARFKRLKGLYDKYERILIPGTLVFGVAVDFVTFRSIQINTAFLLLLVHLVVAGSTIAFMHIYDASKRKDQESRLRYFRLAAPLVVQFTFGALLSASLIFYWFSGSFSVSWPFMIIIAALMGSNDVLRHYYLKPVVQIGVYYFIIFSLFALVLPYAFNSIEPWVFLTSGVASLFAMLLYVEFLGKYLVHVRYQRSGIAVIVVGIFIVMNGLYFANIIPPIPLSLTEAGIYHSVQRIGGEYHVVSEPESFLDRILPGQTIHIVNGERIYVFASIFAPADLDTTIYHDWQYYDVEIRQWVSRSRPSYSLFGGRGDGYRGFSFSSNVSPGLWRVDVETERGQTMGRIRFNVEHVEEAVELQKLIK
ncbi:DUF2914 domain-containing protein [Candidatus Uhrbacteria bacterium]|nr:DUF2914 domain-containing protein [Candidatus Uhrbacteria bacterium]